MNTHRQIRIDQGIYDSLKRYCKLSGETDFNAFVERVLNLGLWEMFDEHGLTLDDPLFDDPDDSMPEQASVNTDKSAYTDSRPINSASGNFIDWFNDIVDGKPR